MCISADKGLSMHMAPKRQSVKGEATVVANNHLDQALELVSEAVSNKQLSVEAAANIRQ